MELESTRSGKFGYEIINDEFCIPYIFRKEIKYCATKIYLAHFEKQLPHLKSDNLKIFSFFKVYEMHIDETKLMNEINEWHNDSMYQSLGCTYKFQTKDTLMKLDDVRTIFQYLYDCEKKSKMGSEFQMCGNIVKICLPSQKKIIVLPYISKENQRFSPCNLIASFLSHKIHISDIFSVTKLTNMDVLYMRFLMSQLKISVQDQNLELSCINLDAFIKYMTKDENNYDCQDNFWPTEAFNNNNQLMNNNDLPYFSNTHKNNNSLDQLRKEKCSSPMVMVQKLKVDSVPRSEKSKAISKERREDTSNVHSKKLRKEEPKHTLKKPKEKSKNEKQNISKKEEDESVVYEVERLVNYKKYKNGKEFVLVRWKGYSSHDDSWEPISNLNSLELFQSDLDKLRQV